MFVERHRTIKEIAEAFGMTYSNVNILLHNKLGDKYKSILLEIKKEQKEKNIIIGNCQLCGKETRRIIIKQRFCSKKCYNDFRAKYKFTPEQIKAKQIEYSKNYYLRKKYEKQNDKCDNTNIR